MNCRYRLSGLRATQLETMNDTLPCPYLHVLLDADKNPLRCMHGPYNDVLAQKLPNPRISGPLAAWCWGEFTTLQRATVLHAAETS